MHQKAAKKLTYSDIGYKGKPIDALTREELLDGFLELAQRVYDCASQGNHCKNLFFINS
jgi:hypothetical protein